MCKLRFTVKTHTINALEHLQTALLSLAQIGIRDLPGHRPTFFRRISAYTACPNLDLIPLPLLLGH